MIKGIDVSEHNGILDVAKIKESGIGFIIIRTGYGMYYEDKHFRSNVAKCEAAGMPYGFYHYSYARNLSEAKTEVEGMLNSIRGMKPSYPVYIDMEDSDHWKEINGNPSNVAYQDICEYFCKRLEEAGYYAGIYANLDWLRNRLNVGKLNRFDKWVAQWAASCTYSNDFGIWQYTSDGTVTGSSPRTDMNYAYKDYPTIIKQSGLNGYGKTPVVPAPQPVPNPEPSASTKYSEGTPVCTCILAESSTGGKIFHGDWSGTITKVLSGRPYPYLLNNGTGWTNDEGIDNDPHIPGKQNAKPIIKEGSKVRVRSGARDYNGAALASFVYTRVYTIQQLNGKRAVLKEIQTAVNTDNLYLT